MNTFGYTAVDQAGSPVRGVVEARDWPAALAMLAERGYRECRSVLTPEQTAGFPRLGSGDALELAGYVSDAAAAGVPLSEALQRLAADARSRSMRAALQWLSGQLAAGVPLEGALEVISARLPAYVRQMIAAGVRSGHLAETLDQVLSQQREMESLSRKFRQAVMYPAILLIFLVSWVLFISLWVIPQMKLDELMGEFGNQLPPTAARPLEFVRVAPPLIGATVVLLAMMLALVWLLAGAGGVSRCVGCLPLVGRAWRYRGLAEYSGLMAVFLKQRQTLAEALQLTAAAARDPAVRGASRKLAGQVSQGRTLHEGMSRQGTFSPLLAQLVTWGESRGTLPGVFSTCQRMYVDRFDQQVQLIRLVVPPAAFLLIAGVALFVSGGAFRIFSLIREFASYSSRPVDPSLIEVAGIELSGVAGVLMTGVTLLVCANLLVLIASSATALSGLLRFCGVVLLAVGIAGACAVVPAFWGWVGWFAAMVVWMRCAVHYRAAERRDLLGVLMLAVDRRLPLPPVIRAFAQEQEGGHAVQARQLADHLERGMPLADAIWLTPGALPRDAALAVKVGEDTGDLLGAMRAANPSLLFERTLARPVLWRLAYIVPVLLMFVLFMKIKIEPSFIKIFADFDQPLPYFSQLIFGMPLVSLVFPAFAGDALSLLVVLAFVAATVFLALGVAGILQWRGTWRPWLPVLRPIVNWVDAAPVLRLMALETQRGRPLTALSSAARLHPKAAVRQRLQAIVQDLNGGVAWQKSLYQQRLLSVADVAVLAAAERAGNLPWALEETADSFERRANYRLQALAQVVAPLLLVPVALLAGAMIVAYFLPLTNLIRSLS